MKIMNKLERHETKIEKQNRSRRAKKILLMGAVIACVVLLGAVSASAASDFTTDAKSKLVTIITMLGGGLGIWGVINLLEGYGSDNPGAKSQGIKQVMAGIGIILASTLVNSITWG